MDDRSLADDLSKLISGSAEPAPPEQSSEEGKNLLADSLKTIAGLSGGPLEAAVSDFLNGSGELHEATRAAVERGKSATSELESLLIKQFNLSPTVAKMVAALLVKLIPALKDDAAAGKKKPRKKPKPKKPAAKKKPKKKPTPKSAKEEAAAKKKPRKKKPATKPAAKKKPKAKTGKKKTRTETVEVQ